MDKVILTEEELAEYLGIEKLTMQAIRRDNKGPVYRKVGNGVWYHREMVERWVQGIDPPRSIEKSTEAVVPMSQRLSG